jgi:D-alanyl-lipoteichoic acid acyltransferase DltB (MBOAT superfamily)
VLFPTVGFAIFFPLVFLGAWLLRPWPERWKAFLLLSSIVFFGWWDWRACLVLAAMVVVAQVAAVALDRSPQRGERRVWLLGAVAVEVLAFVVVVRAGVGGPDLGVVVPLGVGLLLLRCLSYVFDVHRGVLRPAPLIDAALALSFFPPAVAGPLVRPSQLLPQLAAPPDARHVQAARAFRLLLVGLFEVWVLAAFLRVQLVEPVFADPEAHSALEVLVASIGFTVELFALLAGYASMAVGAALLLGLRLPENFAAPFTATRLRDFWRRWTVTFSLWFRDYVYLPLGGSGLGPAVQARNLVVTMTAAGLWFAGGWIGLLWGLAMGVALAVERGVDANEESAGRAATVGWLVTMVVVVAGFTVLRAGDLAAVGELVSRLAVWGSAPLVTPLVILVIAATIAVQFLPRDVPRAVDVGFSRLPLAVQAIALALSLLVVDALGQGIVDPTVPARF